MTEQEFLEKHKAERQPCEVWSRVMGYLRPTSSFNKGKVGELRPTSSFNKGKVGEFNERKFFKEPNRNKEE